MYAHTDTLSQSELRSSSTLALGLLEALRSAPEQTSCNDEMTTYIQHYKLSWASMQGKLDKARSSLTNEQALRKLTYLVGKYNEPTYPKYWSFA